MKTMMSRAKPKTTKQVTRDFDDDGRLVREQHIHGALEIGISREFDRGRRTSETYFYKRRVVSRPTYERARIEYPDMPPANLSIEDSGGALLAAAGRAQRARGRVAKTPRPNAAKARKLDEFCTKLMRTGRREDAVKWLRSKKHTLGEMTWSASQRLIKKLVALGAVRVLACTVDSYENGQENTGHLVVELPRAKPERVALLKEIDRVAEDQGYAGDADYGQRYAYVKLD
jgi:hypothetical protein